MYINSYGEIPVTLRITKDDKTLIYIATPIIKLDY